MKEIPAGSLDRDEELDDLIRRAYSWDVPSYRSSLTINSTLTYKFIRRVPSRWNRFWYRVLLGWTWEDLTKKKSL